MKRVFDTRKMFFALRFMAALPPLHVNRQVYASCLLCKRFIDFVL